MDNTKNCSLEGATRSASTDGVTYNVTKLKTIGKKQRSLDGDVGDDDDDEGNDDDVAVTVYHRLIAPQASNRSRGQAAGGVGGGFVLLSSDANLLCYAVKKVSHIMTCSSLSFNDSRLADDDRLRRTKHIVEDVVRCISEGRAPIFDENRYTVRATESRCRVGHLTCIWMSM